MDPLPKPRRLIVIRPTGPPHQVEQYDLTEMVRREVTRENRRRAPPGPKDQDAPLRKE